MHDVKYSITVRFVVVAQEIQAIRSKAVRQYLQNLLIRLTTFHVSHVYRRHVVRILYAEPTVTHHRVNANRDTLVHRRIADQNASSIPIVQHARHVLITNAKIHVQARAGRTQSAESLAILSHVFVRVDLPEIHLCNVLSGKVSIEEYCV